MSIAISVHNRTAKRNSTLQSTQQTGFATVEETAEFLRLSRAMVHRMVRNGDIPAKHFGRAIRISWSWLYGQVE